MSAGPLSAEQVAGLAGLCNPPPSVPPTASQCYSVSNSLSGTISDNTTYGLMALYNFGRTEDLRRLGAREVRESQHARCRRALSPSAATMLAYVNNDAYAVNKTLEIYWLGGKYALTENLEFTLAYYGYYQDAYATGADAGCSSTISAKCSGELNAVSGLVDYRFTKRFDVYLGSMWTGVRDGTGQRLPQQGHHRHHRGPALQVLKSGDRRHRPGRTQAGPRKRARFVGAAPDQSAAVRPLAEATGDVVLGEAVARVGEDAVGIADLDQLTQVEVGGALRDARRLLHGVGDDHDRVRLAQLIDQILDACGGDRVERRARLVHEDHLRLHRDGARDAQALLLAARQAGAGAAQAVLDLIPQTRRASGSCTRCHRDARGCAPSPWMRGP